MHSSIKFIITCKSQIVLTNNLMMLDNKRKDRAPEIHRAKNQIHSTVDLLKLERDLIFLIHPLMRTFASKNIITISCIA